MDHKELGTSCSVTTSVNDGSTKFALSSPAVQTSRLRSYDVGPNSVGKVDAAAVRPCAIIGPDRVLPPNTDDTMYMKKMPGETWPSADNTYRGPPDYPSKMSDYQPTRNISPRQTFQENMQRIMVPPTFSSMKNSDESSFKNVKMNMPQEAKYCDVPYNLNSVNSELKGVRNPDIPISNVNPSYTRTVPPPYGWPAGVNVRPLRPFGAPEFYQYQDFPSCAGPRPMTMIRPHRPLQEESAQIYSERLYQDANIRFKPYATGKEKHQQSRYDYISNYASTFHPPAPLPPHKYDLQKPIHGHQYPAYPQVPFKYLDRRLHEPFVDGYHRSHNPQTNFNSIHNQVGPPPYGPVPGNCMQNKTYSDISSKPMKVNKLQFENNNKVYFNLESRSKNYSIPENVYYNDVTQTMRGDILLPPHSALNVHPIHQHTIYRKDHLKSYDYNPNLRIFDQSVNVNHSLQRLPLQFSPNTVAISPSDSNTSDTPHIIGMSQEDCGYVSQSSTASIRSVDSGNISIPHDIYRRHSYNYDIIRNTYHTQIPKNKNSPPHKKNLNVRQFLQMWNEGDEEASESNKEAATSLQPNNYSAQSELINNQEQLYVLGLVNVPNEELGKYDHIQKISKLPENIKGYNSIEILNQYEELLETPHTNNYNKSAVSRDYSSLSKKSLTDKEMMMKLPRPVSPLDVEAKISQSVIHKEVGCNFEIKPCSPEMLNVEVAKPVQSILGERMIEKVVNPTITKSPNMSRNDNVKSSTHTQKSEAVKVTSCKMIGNHYSSKNSPNVIKTSNYSMQDMECNVGLCLASLPQLDNDIELNFPEINQQFIKANQMEPNAASNLQHLSHLDLEQTHSCFPQEIKTDSQQSNISPQLTSTLVADKEISKLSKYRKGKKCELGLSTQNILNAGDSTAVLQRIDSVIIKNPDNIKSHDSEFVKLASEKHHVIENETEQFVSLECGRSNETYDLSSETAIDFSLNRTEDETAVNYLNAIDENLNQHLPTLEELNECDDLSFPSSNNKAQIAEIGDSISGEQFEQPKSVHSEASLAEAYEINNQQIHDGQVINQQIRCDNIVPIPVTSPKCSAHVEDQNVLVSKKLPTESEITAAENPIYTTTDSLKKLETPTFNIEGNTGSCLGLNEKKISTNPKEDTLQSNDKIEKSVESELDESKKCIDNISKTIKYSKGDVEQSTCETFTVINMDKKKNCGIESAKKQPEETVDLEILPKRDIVNMDIKSNISHMIKNDVGQMFLPSKDTDLEKLPDIDQINEENLNINLEKSNISNTFPKMEIEDYATKINTKNIENVCSETTEVTSDVKSQTCFTIMPEKNGPNFSLPKSNQDIVFQSEPQNDSNINKNISGFECSCKEGDNTNIMNEPSSSLSTEIHLGIQGFEPILAQDDAKQMVVSENASLSNKSDMNTFNVNNEICIFSNKTENLISSIDNLEESRRATEEDQKEETEHKSCETNITEHSSSSDERNRYTMVPIKESCFHTKNETSSENSNFEINKSGPDMEICNNDFTSTLKIDLNARDLECNDTISKQEIKIKLLNNENNQTITKKDAHFKKELFSPWIQKLLTLNEGNCKFVANSTIDKQIDLVDKIEEVSLLNNNLEDNLSKNNDKVFQLKNNDINQVINITESLDPISEVTDDNNSKDSSYFTSLQGEQIIEPDNDTLKENYKLYTSKMASEIEVIKPQKILKRSLSESALEEYNNNDIQFLQPCKRKKGTHSFVESHIIPEDICNIIQTNRRNSISTFYNEENVYIVIDNDLILTEDGESDKICYTDINEEFSTTIEPTNCNIDLTSTTNSSSVEQNLSVSTSLQNIDEEPSEDSWVEDVACIETVFSEDVAENIIIDVQHSPNKINSLDLENVDHEAAVFCDSDHIDKIKTIYGRTMCNNNTQLIETLYRTPQMNVNKTLYDIESQGPEDYLTFVGNDSLEKNCSDSTKHIDCTDILETEITSYKVIDNKENMAENVSLNSKNINQNVNQSANHTNDIKYNTFSPKEQDTFTIHSCESSNDFLTSSVQKENSNYSCSSSPEVSSTTSEEKSSSILLKITNCNGSRVSQINEICSDMQSRLSYKLTEKQEYRSYSSSRTLITKAAQKYIPPINETVYDLKVKLPLPQHRLHTLKQLKIAKVKPKIDTIANNWQISNLKPKLYKKQKPKFEDVLKSIDEIHFKKHKDKIKKGKTSIPKVVIKKNENGAHYASSKTTSRKEIYNPDLTGLKWQPWVFLEKNNFIDGMALQNKLKAIYCHRKNSYVLADKFRKYKSIYNANFIISDTSTKGNLKYTIRLKQT